MTRSRSKRPPLACGFAPIRRSPCGASAASVEQLFGLVAAHPRVEYAEVLRILSYIRERNLMRAERSLDLHAIDDLRPRPTFGRAQDQHRPARPRSAVLGARLPLDCEDTFDEPIQRPRHAAMHLERLVAFEHDRLVTVAGEKRR